MLLLGPDGPRLRELMSGSLPEAVKLVYANADKTGGSVVGLCVSLVTQLLQNEPAAAASVIDAGLITAFVDALGDRWPVHAMVWFSSSCVVSFSCSYDYCCRWL